MPKWNNFKTVLDNLKSILTFRFAHENMTSLWRICRQKNTATASHCAVLMDQSFGSHTSIDCIAQCKATLMPNFLDKPLAEPKPAQLCCDRKLVGATGVEPARITPQDPKSCASANSATRPALRS